MKFHIFVNLRLFHSSTDVSIQPRSSNGDYWTKLQFHLQLFMNLCCVRRPKTPIERCSSSMLVCMQQQHFVNWKFIKREHDEGCECWRGKIVTRVSQMAGWLHIVVAVPTTWQSGDIYAYSYKTLHRRLEYLYRCGRRHLCLNHLYRRWKYWLGV